MHSISSSQTCKQQIHSHLQAIDKIDKINGVGAGSKGAPTPPLSKGGTNICLFPLFCQNALAKIITETFIYPAT